MQADLILRGATVVTMATDETGAGAPLAIAILDGRIAAVVPEGEAQRWIGDATRVVDVSGKTIVPGFIDSHVHFTQTGLGSLGPQVYDVTRRAQVLETVAAAHAMMADGEPMLVHGLAIADLDAPITMADLDRIAPRRAVMIGDVGAHGCIVSSAAWAMLELGALDGIGRDAQGRPDGVLTAKANTWARYQYYNRAISDARRAQALQRASQMAAEVGITTVHALEGGSPDGRGWLPERDVAVLLAEQATLPVRTVVYFQSTDVQKALDWQLPRIGGCIWVDGAYGEFTAALLEPYCNCAGCTGSLYFSDDELYAFVDRAHRAGLQISMHAIGDAAIEQLLNAYERALTETPRADHRHRIEHFSLPTEAHIARAARLGVAVGMQPNFAMVPDPLPQPDDEPAGLVAYLGYERYQRRHPYRRIVDAGVLVAGGSDADPMPMGPLIGMQRLAAHPEAARRLSAREALALYTVNGARIAFEEHLKGSIEPGKYADLVVLADNPLLADPSTLASIAVEQTIVNGRVVHARGADH
ncbi:amidohydrolase [Solimonas marina]|uniref:Amidohydrolase n=1 Tax=Solimonas marina TaxID=2714601 RepID=A0A969WCA5_9GAMM|nr:amidohydrolase [Solimonas marina]NKF23569.1 amidohydrolase [Solimonas marina]